MCQEHMPAEFILALEVRTPPDTTQTVLPPGTRNRPDHAWPDPQMQQHKPSYICEACMDTLGRGFLGEGARRELADATSVAAMLGARVQEMHDELCKKAAALITAHALAQPRGKP